MESNLVSGALFFVMILLLMVVYESNTTMQRIVARIMRRKSKGKSKNRTEDLLGIQQAAIQDIRDVTIGEAQESVAAASHEAIGTEPQEAIMEDHQTTIIGNDENTGVPFELIEEKEETTSKGILAWYGSYFSRIFRRGDRGKSDGTLDVSRESANVSNEEIEMITATVQTIQGTVDDLTNRLAQSEKQLAKIDPLEEGLTKAGEETQMVSEEMRDILGSIRSSIDGLENRLNQMGSEVAEVKAREPQIVRVENTPVESASNTIDEETLNKMQRLEMAIADINETVGTLPEEVRNALAYSQNAMNSAQDLDERVEIISDNLQSTLGYSVRKTFRCESCGTQGFVASQVSCSKCGTSGWFGWWPPDQEIPESMCRTTAEINNEEKQPDVTEMAEMFESATEEFENAEEPGSTEMTNLAEMLQVVGAGDLVTKMEEVPELAELAEMLESTHTTGETEGANEIGETDEMIEPDSDGQEVEAIFPDVDADMYGDEIDDTNEIGPDGEKPGKKARKPKKKSA